MPRPGAQDDARVLHSCQLRVIAGLRYSLPQLYDTGTHTTHTENLMVWAKPITTTTDDDDDVLSDFSGTQARRRSHAT